MSDPGTITNLLGLTMVGDTNSIKQAEASLENLHQDPNFIPHLLLIPKETSIPCIHFFTQTTSNNPH